MEDTSQGHPDHQAWRTPEPEEVFARRLRSLREKAGLTQQQVADQMRLRGCPLHRSAIAKIEADDPANRRPVRVNEAVALADVLGVPVTDLVVDPIAQRRQTENMKHREVETARLETELQEARMACTALQYEVRERRDEAARAAQLLGYAEQRLEEATRYLAVAEHRLRELQAKQK